MQKKFQLECNKKGTNWKIDQNFNYTGEQKQEEENENTRPQEWACGLNCLIGAQLMGCLQSWDKKLSHQSSWEKKIMK